MQRNDDKHSTEISAALNKLKVYQASLATRTDEVGKDKDKFLKDLLPQLESDLSASHYLYLLRMVQKNQETIDRHKKATSDNTQLRDICNELLAAYYAEYKETLEQFQPPFKPSIYFKINNPIDLKLLTEEIEQIKSHIEELLRHDLPANQQAILRNELLRYEYLNNILIGEIGKTLDPAEIKNIQAYLSLLVDTAKPEEYKKYDSNNSKTHYTQDKSLEHLQYSAPKSEHFGLREQNITAATLLANALAEINPALINVDDFNMLMLNNGKMSVKINDDDIFRLADKSINNIDVVNLYLDDLIKLLREHKNEIDPDSPLLKSPLIKKMITMIDNPDFDSRDIPSLSTYLENEHNIKKLQREALKEKIDTFGIPNNVNGKTVEDLLGTKGTAILHAGTAAGKSKREQFIDELIEVLHDSSTDFKGPITNPNDDAVKMEALFGGGEKGKRLLQLYKEAIEEESNSKAFRDAVMLRSTEHRKGETWKQRLILWVGGPSACGKSVTKNKILDECSGKMEKSGTSDGNYIVSIDGAIERETSQIRQLALQAALQKGYPGIKDLDKHTKHGIKKRIQKAALSSPTLNLLIPNTFSNPLTIKKIQKFSKLPNTTQYFSEIVGSNEETFRETVERNGNNRAYASSYGTPTPETSRQLQINNTNIGCESKQYHKQNFDAGKSGSEQAAKEFHRLNPGHYIKVTSDWVYVIKDGDEWRKCRETDKSGEIQGLSERQFAKWSTLSPRPDLQTWLASKEAKADELIGTIVEITKPTQTASASLASTAAALVARDSEAALKGAAQLLSSSLPGKTSSPTLSAKSSASSLPTMGVKTIGESPEKIAFDKIMNHEEAGYDDIDIACKYASKLNDDGEKRLFADSLLFYTDHSLAQLYAHIELLRKKKEISGTDYEKYIELRDNVEAYCQFVKKFGYDDLNLKADTIDEHLTALKNHEQEIAIKVSMEYKKEFANKLFKLANSNANDDTNDHLFEMLTNHKSIVQEMLISPLDYGLNQKMILKLLKNNSITANWIYIALTKKNDDGSFKYEKFIQVFLCDRSNTPNAVGKKLLEDLSSLENELKIYNEDKLNNPKPNYRSFYEKNGFVIPSSGNIDQTSGDLIDIRAAAKPVQFSPSVTRKVSKSQLLQAAIKSPSKAAIALHAQQALSKKNELLNRCKSLQNDTNFISGLNLLAELSEPGANIKVDENKYSQLLRWESRYHDDLEAINKLGDELQDILTAMRKSSKNKGTQSSAAPSEDNELVKTISIVNETRADLVQGKYQIENDEECYNIATRIYHSVKILGDQPSRLQEALTRIRPPSLQSAPSQPTDANVSASLNSMNPVYQSQQTVTAASIPPAPQRGNEQDRLEEIKQALIADLKRISYTNNWVKDQLENTASPLNINAIKNAESIASILEHISNIEPTDDNFDQISEAREAILTAVTYEASPALPIKTPSPPRRDTDASLKAPPPSQHDADAPLRQRSDATAANPSDDSGLSDDDINKLADEIMNELYPPANSANPDLYSSESIPVDTRVKPDPRPKAAFPTQATAAPAAKQPPDVNMPSSAPPAQAAAPAAPAVSTTPPTAQAASSPAASAHTQVNKQQTTDKLTATNKPLYKKPPVPKRVTYISDSHKIISNDFDVEAALNRRATTITSFAKGRIAELTRYKKSHKVIEEPVLLLTTLSVSPNKKLPMTTVAAVHKANDKGEFIADVTYRADLQLSKNQAMKWAITAMSDYIQSAESRGEKTDKIVLTGDFPADFIAVAQIYCQLLGKECINNTNVQNVNLGAYTPEEIKNKAKKLHDPEYSRPPTPTLPSGPSAAPAA